MTNSFTLETSFYGYDKGGETTEFSEQEFFQIGRELAHTLNTYCFLEKELERELKFTNGWLKPSRLKEITGKPAAEALRERIEEERKEEKKKQRQERFNKFIEDKKNKKSKKSAGERKKPKADKTALSTITK